MLVKVPPFIVIAEQLGKNDMIWWLVIRTWKKTRKWSRVIVKKQIPLHVPVLEGMNFDTKAV